MVSVGSVPRHASSDFSERQCLEEVWTGERVVTGLWYRRSESWYGKCSHLKESAEKDERHRDYVCHVAEPYIGRRECQVCQFLICGGAASWLLSGV